MANKKAATNRKPPQTRQQRTTEALGSSAVDHGADLGTEGPHTGLEQDRENPEPKWAPADNLYAPPPPDGIEQRWCRFMRRGELDRQNMAKSRREGWEPVRAKDISDEHGMHSLETESLGDLGEVFSTGDLILCRRDARLGVQRTAHYNERLRTQTEAVHGRMKNVDKDSGGTMPSIVDISSKKSNRRPVIAADD